MVPSNCRLDSTNQRGRTPFPSIAATLGLLFLTITLSSPSSPGFAEPIVVIEDKSSGDAPNQLPPLGSRRSAWLAELDRTRSRIKRKTGVELDIELAKSLCRSGSMERCEDAVAQLQNQITTIITSLGVPPQPPSVPQPPQSNTSVVIVTEPRLRNRPDPTYPPPIFGTPKFPDRRHERPNIPDHHDSPSAAVQLLPAE